MIKEETEYLSWLKVYLENIHTTKILENFLDLQIIEMKEGKVTYSCTLKEMHSNLYGFAHGGVLASICDVVMGGACITLDKLVVTIDISISYIKNIQAGETLIAKGEVISSGNTIMRASGEIYHNNQLLVKSQASYFITR